MLGGAIGCYSNLFKRYMLQNASTGKERENYNLNLCPALNVQQELIWNHFGPVALQSQVSEMLLKNFCKLRF